MYALRTILGLAFLLVQGGILLWTGLGAQPYAPTPGSVSDPTPDGICAEYPLVQRDHVSVRTSGGDFQVRHWDRPTVRITATGHVHDDQPTPGPVCLQFARGADGVQVSACCPDHQPQNRCRVSCVIDLPADAVLDLATADDRVALAAR